MAGYAKLFQAIVTSSIWCADDRTFRVWIAMLATCDQEGVVEGSVPGFASLCRVSPAELQSSLDILASPDPYSRTADHEGRRIEAVAGGWRILNFKAYRDRGQGKEGSRAPYMRTRRAAQKAEKEPDHLLQPDVTRYTEAEAASEAKAEHCSSVETPPNVPRDAGPRPAAAPGGSENPERFEKPEPVPAWLAQDLAELGVNQADQRALHRRLGTLPLRAAVVQLQRKGGIRKPAALLLTKGAELAVEGAALLGQFADYAETEAPSFRRDRGWLGQPEQVRADPEIRAAWAGLRIAEEALVRARGGGGELEALDTVAGARRQLNGLLTERGGTVAPARASPPVNVQRLAAPG